MPEKQIGSLILREIQIPSMPAIAVRILDIIHKDETSLSELGEIISVDPALSAKMLKIANSGLFFRNKEITNINRAMSLLGTNIVKCIALSFVIASDLCGQQSSGLNIDEFWRRSITAAVSAEVLTKFLHREDENIFLIALLQDLGILTMLLTKGDDYQTLLQNYQDVQVDLTVMEKDKYRFDHQQVGNVLMANWNFPEAIAEPVLYHHHPEVAPDKYRDTAVVLSFADRLAEIYCGTEIAEKARLLQKDLVGRFKIEESETLELLDSVAEKSREMISIFDLDPQDIQPYSILLQRANTELKRLNLDNAQIIMELQESKGKIERLAQKLKEANTRLQELVNRDGQTGLYNHRFFHESLEKELSRATRFKSSLSLVLFDLDDFKVINDTYGHLAGDLVLTSIAKTVIKNVRNTDIVARYGGDEFAIILPGTNVEGLEIFTKNLKLHIEGATTLVTGQSIHVTISLGAVTVVPSQYQISKEALIEVADRGLYMSKQNGRNQVTLFNHDAE